ncbi:hypothetical protein AOL_s00078g438 [Orbilia oligospora ATCC 24927]|uniref:Nitrogen regulatory protein areA GATA-like domain-containing protein n=1 Tax=Arthrobotrys oligospora (strain ATCC 24927 / CBS 115.81 / DSM 1491) TaxID=756982 RepID=G1XBZ1_ARTOA|nr:hypothetical protein AOL_s00078g438 [Orbilia oligospora ATCC 24927]EGX49405.1 hypothetical protein AOL_s00078g438 [Orbilia oligospora ATCC 24927]
MMNHGLPQIVDNRHSLTDDIRKIDKVQVEELTRLWKVYTTNKNIIATGRRLENLFWRIWGSTRIQENISGNTVAKIFLMIDQGEEAIANSAYKIPPPSKSVIKQVPVDISVPPTPPPSPYSRLSPSNNVLYQPSQTALSASLLQAYPNTPPSPAMPPKVPPPSPAVLPEAPIRPALTRGHQSYPLTTNNAQVQIGREIVSTRPKNGTTARGIKHKGILRKGKQDKKRGLRPAAPSRTTSNSSNATASSGRSTPVTATTEITNLQDAASQSGKDTDYSSTSVRSGASSRKSSEVGSTKSKEDWLVEPDFRAKYLEQRKKDRLSAIAGNPIVKGPLKTNATIATASMTAVAIPRTKRGGRGRSILVVDSVVPLKSAGDEGTPGPAVPVVESAFLPISEVLPSIVEKEAFERPVFQRTKSQLSLMIEQSKRNPDSETSTQTNTPQASSSKRISPPPEVILEENVQLDEGFETEEGEQEDEGVEMKQKLPKKTAKSRRPKVRTRKS